MIYRSIILVLVVSSVNIFPSKTIANASTSAQEAILRVNVAGRQRMLSQRMVKAACLMATDITPSVAFDQLTQAYDLFVRSDSALRLGDEQLGLGPEKFGSVLESLQAIDQPWSIQKLVVEKGIDSAAISAAELAALNSASLDVLSNMNTAVFTTARAHAATVPKVSFGLTLTVDVAGRQRMLTQRAVKEACLMRIADNPERFAAKLLETVALFDASLGALRNGHPMAGIVPPTSPEVERKLSDVAELWRPLRVLLDQAASEKSLSARDLEILSRDVEPLLRTMNEAVGLY